MSVPELLCYVCVLFPNLLEFLKQTFFFIFYVTLTFLQLIYILSYSLQLINIYSLQKWFTCYLFLALPSDVVLHC